MVPSKFVLRTLNRRTRTAAHSSRICMALVNLNCVFIKKIVKINHKTMKSVIVYEIHITIKIIKRKVIIVILKERKGFRARVFVQHFLNALKSLSGNAAILNYFNIVFDY